MPYLSIHTGLEVDDAVTAVPTLEAALPGKAPLVHTHPQSDITGLVSDLAGKAPLTHTHPQSDITGLTSDLAGKAPLVHTHTQSDITGLTGSLASLTADVAARLQIANDLSELGLTTVKRNNARNNLDVLWADKTRSNAANRSSAGGFYADGSSAGYRITGVGGSLPIGLSDFTISFTLALADYTPAVQGVLFVTHSVTASNRVSVSFTGQFLLQFWDAVATPTNIALTPDVLLVDGETYQITIAVTRSGNAVLYINGISDRDKNGTGVVASVAAFSALDIGSGNATTYGLWYLTEGTLFNFRLYNRALSATDALKLADSNSVDPADVGASLTQLVNGSTVNGGFETAGTGGTDAFANWSESASGASTITRDTVEFHSGAACCKFTVDGSASACAIASILLVVGRRYTLEFWAKADSTTGGPSLASDSDGAVNVAILTTTWTKYIWNFIARITTFTVKRGSGTANRQLFLDDLVLGPAGCVLDLDLGNANPAVSLDVRDRQGVYHGTITAPSTYPFNPVPQLNLADSLVVQKTDVLTNAVLAALTVKHNTTAIPVAPFGVRSLFRLKSSTTADQDAASQDVSWADATHATRSAAWILNLVDNALALAPALDCRFSVLNGFRAPYLGIGASPPLRPLHIKVASLGGGYIALENPDSTDLPSMGITYRSTTTGAGAAAFTEFASIRALLTVHNHATRTASFDINILNAGATDQFEFKPGRIFNFVGGAAQISTTTGDLTLAPVAASAVNFSKLDALTATLALLYRTIHNSSGTPAAGYGTRILHQLKSSTTDAQDAVAEEVSWVDATHATRSADWTVKVLDQAVEKLGLSLRYYSNGTPRGAALGIGTVPTRSLHVRFDSAGSPSIFMLENADSTNANAIGITLRSTTTGAGGAAQQDFASIFVILSEHNNAAKASVLQLAWYGAGAQETVQFISGYIQRFGAAAQIQTSAGDLTLAPAGNVSITKPLKLGTRVGNATLVGGTVTVPNTTVTANTVVMLTRKTIGGTTGEFSYTLNAGVSFVINSANAGDTSVVSYLLIEP